MEFSSPKDCPVVLGIRTRQYCGINALTSHHFLAASKRRSSWGRMPLMISFRFLRDLGLVSRLVTLVRFVGGVGFQVIGALEGEDCSRSRARTLVDSGGSLIWDASVGSDHSEGDELKIVVDECERMEPKYILRGASSDAPV